VSLEQLLGAHPVATAIISHLRPWVTVLAARATCRTFRRTIEAYMKSAALPPAEAGGMVEGDALLTSALIAGWQVACCC
jgi:hypothetical protein